MCIVKKDWCPTKRGSNLVLVNLRPHILQTLPVRTYAGEKRPHDVLASADSRTLSLLVTRSTELLCNFKNNICRKLKLTKANYL